MRRIHIWASGAVAALVMLAVFWLLLAPGWALLAIKQSAAEGLGRNFEAAGGVHLEFSPQLAVRLDGVSLANPADSDNPLLTAKALRIPVSVVQLFSHRLDASRILLDEPAIALRIDERGKASWDAEPSGAGAALAMEFTNGSVRYFDARNGQSFAASNANLAAAISADGGMTLRGTADVKGRLARLDATVKSIARIHRDGSPADVTLDAPDLSLTFNGRLATSKVLSLDGMVSLNSADALATARWVGIAIERPELGSFSISGGLEAAGRAFAVHQAGVKLGKLEAKGDISLDFRNAVPKLQAALQSPMVDLEAAIPASGAKTGEWGAAPLGFSNLKAIDAQVSIEAQGVVYGGLAGGPARMTASIAEGRLTATLDSEAVAGGRMKLSAAVDGAAAPPGFALIFRGEGVDAAKLFPVLAAVNWLSGHGAVAVSLSGSGQSQQEIIGSLGGSMEMTLNSGAIQGLAIAEGLDVARQRSLDGWPSGPAARTEFDTLTVKAAVADGIATLTGLALDSPSLTLGGKGDIDLLRRSLDLKVEATLKTGGFPEAVAVGGQWAAPIIAAGN